MAAEGLVEQEVAAGSGQPPGLLRCLIVLLGGQETAIPLAPGAEVLEFAELQPVPTAPSFLLGLGQAHGRTLSVVDPRPTLSLASTRWALPLRAVALDDRPGALALAVEAALRMVPLPPAVWSAERPLLAPVQSEAGSWPMLSTNGLTDHLANLAQVHNEQYRAALAGSGPASTVANRSAS